MIGLKKSRETDFVESWLTTLMIKSQLCGRQCSAMHGQKSVSMTQISALASMFTLCSWDAAGDSVRGLRAAVKLFTAWSGENKLKSFVEKTTFNYFFKTYLLQCLEQGFVPCSSRISLYYNIIIYSLILHTMQE
jgi:hypothetical protein